MSVFSALGPIWGQVGLWAFSEASLSQSKTTSLSTDRPAWLPELRVFRTREHLPRSAVEYGKSAEMGYCGSLMATVSRLARLVRIRPA